MATNARVAALLLLVSILAAMAWLATATVASAVAVESPVPTTSAAPAAAEPTPTLTPAPTATPVPVFTDFYRNTTEGFSLTLPPGWLAEETGELTPALVIEKPQGPEFVYADVWVFRLLEPQPAQEWLMNEVVG